MSTGQAVGGVVGAAAGFVISGGNPMGAMYGAQVGMMVGGYLDPPKGPTMEGPRLSDLSVQTSTYGAFIPRTYGTIAVSGNVFWLENNQIKEVVKKEKQGGKGGGGGTTVKTYSYFATFAVGLCEGPISSVRRIWIGPDLIYDSSAVDFGILLAGAKASEKFKIYLGDESQLPDSRMQADVGAANCPAYRGLAYIVFYDLPLEKYGKSLSGAQVRVEVVAVRTLSNHVIVQSQEAIDTQNFGCTNARTSSDKTTYSVTRSNKAYQLTDFGSSAVESELTYITPAQFPSVQVISGSYDRAQHAFRSGPYNHLVSDYFLALGDKTNQQIYNCAGKAPVIGAQYGDYVFAISEGTYGNYSISAFDPISGGAHVSLTAPTQIRGITAGDGRVYTFRNNGSYLEIESFDFDLVSQVVFTPTPLSGSYDPYAPCAYANGNLYIVKSIPSSVSNVFEVAIINIAAQTYRQMTATTSITWLSTTTTPLLFSLKVDGNLLFLSGRAGDYRRTVVAAIDVTTTEVVSLADIVESEVVRSNLIQPSEIDTTLLTDSVTGYKISTVSSIRAAIEPLRSAWPFDVIQRGYGLKAISRGRSPVLTVPSGDIIQGYQIVAIREMDSQLPQMVKVAYSDKGRDYDNNEQQSQRINTDSVSISRVEVPAVLTADQAAQVAEKLLRIYMMERNTYQFSLPPSYNDLEPCDVITLQTDDASYEVRITDLNYRSDGVLECSARANRAATYSSISVGDDGQSSVPEIPYAGYSDGILFDIPVIDETYQNTTGVVAAITGYSSGWSGGIIYISQDSGSSWSDALVSNGKGTIGIVAGTLAQSNGNLVQTGGSIVVSLISGTLESVTIDQMLNGSNIAAYGVDGRWEIIRFANAQLNANGTYTISTFWRGDYGTEQMTGLHESGDSFILLTDPDLRFVTMPISSIGQPFEYRAVTSGSDIDTADSLPLTYKAANLTPYSGANPKATRSGGDISISWTRRTRVGGAWRDNVDAQLGESLEYYEVDVMSGSNVVRTIQTTSPSAIYTSAQQVIDFGSAQSSVNVKIYQLSAVVGRGYPLEATL